MSSNLVTIAWIAAAGLFILSLSGLSHPETARRGNLFGMIGMALALLATAVGEGFSGHAWLIAALIPAAVAGSVLAVRVKMTELPQLVAMLHSFVGAAAVAVGFATLLAAGEHYGGTGAEGIIHAGEIFVGVCVGSITFTGSLVAAAKLHGVISGKPLLLPARHALNLAMLAATVVLGMLFARNLGQSAPQLTWLLLATLITAVLGAHLVAAIGGADMPVVVSMLNSYSGWAAAAAGFMLSNDLLIITGALVGSQRRDPQLHHVQGDEPLVRQRDPRRIWDGRGHCRRAGDRWSTHAD